MIGARQVTSIQSSAEQAAIAVWIVKMDYPGNSRLVRQPSRIAASFLCAEPLPMKGPETAQDFLASGILSGDLHGTFIGFSATEAKKCLLQLAGGNLCQLFSQPSPRIGGDARIHIRKLLGLLFDGVDNVAVTMSNVNVHQLGIEIQVAFAVGIPEVNALAAYRRNGVNRILRSP